MSFYSWRQDTLLLYCHLQPNASRDEFAGEHGERLKIRIKAPPIDGRANAALIRFLSKVFSVPKSRVQLLAGESGRQKTLAIVEPRHIPANLGITCDD